MPTTPADPSGTDDTADEVAGGRADSGDSQGDDRRAVSDVVDAMRTALERGRDVGSTGVGLVGSGVDDAVRNLVAQRVRRVVDRSDGSAYGTSVALSDALRPSTSASTVAGRLGQVGGKLAKRSRAARAVVGRTPTGLALKWGPVLVDAVQDQLRAVDAAAGHLVARAREAEVEPDPERVRLVVVQALTGEPVDPDGTADHHALARIWLLDVGRRAVPFGLGSVGSGKAGPAPAEVSEALAALDAARLGTR